jgi:hypothetical protein
MFDAMLNIVSLTPNAPSEEEIAAGAPPEVMVGLVLGLMLPLADPSDPSRPLMVQGGNLRFRLDADSAVAFGKKLVAEGERLPKRSRIEIASSMTNAEQAAERLNSLRNDR